MVNAVKKAILLIIICLIFLSQVCSAYGQTQSTKSTYDIETLNQKLNKIDEDIANTKKLKSGYESIISWVQKGYNINRFFSKDDVIKYFGENATRENATQRLYSFIQEADDKIGKLTSEQWRITESISDLKLKIRFAEEDKMETFYQQRQKEKFRREDEYNKQVESICRTNRIISDAIDIASWYRVNRPMPNYPNNNNFMLPFYPYFIRCTYPYLPIPPPPQQ